MGVKSSVQMMQLVGVVEALTVAKEGGLGNVMRWISVGSSCEEDVPAVVEGSGTYGSGT